MRVGFQLKESIPIMVAEMNDVPRKDEVIVIRKLGRYRVTSVRWHFEGDRFITVEVNLKKLK